MTALLMKFSRYLPSLMLSGGVTLSCLLAASASCAISAVPRPYFPPSSPSSNFPPFPILSRSRSVPPPSRYTCPIALEPLATTLLRDLPSYMNRLQRRLPQRKQQPDQNLYTIVASQPEFEALPIGLEEYASPADTTLQQVFFTTLERQYTQQGIKEWQSFHWLFLSPTKTGWQLVLLFSRQGDYPRNEQPLTPPRDASQSVAALAIRAWLRDCQAGAVKPLQGQIPTPEVNEMMR